MNTEERRLARWMELRTQLTESGLSRRDAYRLGLLLGGGVLLGSGLRAPRAEAQVVQVYPNSPPTRPWIEPLPIPPTLQPVPSLNPPPRPSAHQYYTFFPAPEFYEMRVRKAKHRFHPDLPESEIFGYEGIYPGPTIDAHYGRPYLLRIINELPADHKGFGIPQVITHLHNFHTAPESDGGPWDWLRPGEYKDHHYTMACAGFSDPDKVPAPYRDDYGGDIRESMNTLFYHDHRPDFTSANVYRGLAGFCRIFDKQDTGNEQDPNPLAWRLPSGEYDIPLVIADKRFDPNTGLLFFDQFTTDGFLGDKMVVNGKVQPYLNVKRRKYRFRVLNASPSRFYRLVLRRSDKRNTAFVQVTDNGNFLQAPRTVSSLELWVADRADIIIDFSAFPAGTVLHLSNTMEMRPDGRGSRPDKTLNPDDVANQIIQFRVQGGTVRDDSRIPSFFRPLPTINLGEAVQTRLWRFNRTNGQWAINGELFDPDIDHTPARLNNPRHQVKRNSAEIWIFESVDDGWDHPVHVHMEEGVATRVDGVAISPSQLSRRDIWQLRGRGRIETFRRFRDFPDPEFSGVPPGIAGRYVMHCHNTVHEDHAMMVSFTVMP